MEPRPHPSWSSEAEARKIDFQTIVLQALWPSGGHKKLQLHKYLPVAF